MRVSQSVVVHATDAVKAYCQIAGIEHDNRIPEIFLDSWIARGLHDDLRVNA